MQKSKGSVHHLPTPASAHARLLEKLVAEMISKHPDKQVAVAWEAMARESMRRYASPPLPTSPVLDLDAIEGLTKEQQNQLYLVTQTWMDSYFNDVRNQLMNIHRDLLGLQRQVAEYENPASSKQV